MTLRTDQLPREAADIARQLQALQRQLDELRAQQLDMSAADAMLPPLDTDPTRWPQTTLAAWTTIASCSNLRWGKSLRLALTTATSGGGAGNIRVTVNGAQWGPTVAAGSAFDNTAALPVDIAIGAQYTITVDAQRTSGAGAVHAQVALIRSIN